MLRSVLDHRRELLRWLFFGFLFTLEIPLAHAFDHDPAHEPLDTQNFCHLGLERGEDTLFKDDTDPDEDEPISRHDFETRYGRTRTTPEIKHLNDELWRDYSPTEPVERTRERAAIAVQLNDRLIGVVLFKELHLDPRNPHIEDFRSTAKTELFNAAMQFDPMHEQGATFGTYAVKIMKNHLFKMVNNTGIVKRISVLPQLEKPVHHFLKESEENNGLSARAIQAILRERHQDDPKLLPLLTEQRIQSVLNNFKLRSTSLSDHETGGEQREHSGAELDWHHLNSLHGTPETEAIEARDELALIFHNALQMDSKDPKDQLVIFLRILAHSDEQYTFQMFEDQYGLSRQRYEAMDGPLRERLKKRSARENQPPSPEEYWSVALKVEIMRTALKKLPLKMLPLGSAQRESLFNAIFYPQQSVTQGLEILQMMGLELSAVRAESLLNAADRLGLKLPPNIELGVLEAMKDKATQELDSIQNLAVEFPLEGPDLCADRLLARGETGWRAIDIYSIWKRVGLATRADRIRHARHGSVYFGFGKEKPINEQQIKARTFKLWTVPEDQPAIRSAVIELAEKYPFHGESALVTQLQAQKIAVWPKQVIQILTEAQMYTLEERTKKLKQKVASTPIRPHALNFDQRRVLEDVDPLKEVVLSLALKHPTAGARYYAEQINGFAIDEHKVQEVLKAAGLDTVRARVNYLRSRYKEIEDKNSFSREQMESIQRKTFESDPDEVANTVIAQGISRPNEGSKVAAKELAVRGIWISPSKVDEIWAEHGLSTEPERIARANQVAGVDRFKTKADTNSEQLVRLLEDTVDHPYSGIRKAMQRLEARGDTLGKGTVERAWKDKGLNTQEGRIAAFRAKYGKTGTQDWMTAEEKLLLK